MSIISHNGNEKQVIDMSDDRINERAEDALLKCLGQVPFATVEPIPELDPISDKRPDLQYMLRAPDYDQLLVIEIKSTGQPKPVRDGVNQVLRYKELYPDSYGVIVAPYISTRSASICLKEEVGYLDFAGNCFLSFQQVYIRMEGQPNPYGQERSLRSLYAPKASRILRVLLANPIEKIWKVKELCKESNVSIGLVSNVKKLLDEREWIEDYDVGFSLSDPGALLREWSDNYSYRNNRVRDFYSLKKISEIESQIAEACSESDIEYALTGFSGAARMAPAVRYQRVMSYVGEGIDRLSRRLELKEVGSGANISLLDPYDEGVLYGCEEVDGILVASPIQVYLDLKGFRGRGEEAAEALLEQVIIPKW